MDRNSNIKKEYTFKYILVGDGFVGKTKISYRFRTDKFEEGYKVTLNVEFAKHTIQVDDTQVNIELWDTSGDENFRAIQKNYFQNSACALVVYDITKKKTFDNSKDWIEECRKYGDNTETLVLVGNKSDLEQEREVPKEEAEEFAKNNNMLFYETSALTGENIQKLFQDSTKIILDNIEKNVYDLTDEGCGIKVIKLVVQIPPDKDNNCHSSCSIC